MACRLSRRKLLIGASVLGALPSVGWSQGERWPARPVRVLVGFPAGQATDIIARTYSADLSKDLGQSFVVENRPGAGSMLAAQQLVRAPNDGYTLMWGGSGNLGIAPYLYKSPGYNPVTDFDTIMVTGIVPMLLVVRTDSEFRSFDELLRAVRSRPMSYGSGGNGVTNHLATELLKMTAQLSIEHVPYKGDAPALQDLMGGQFPFMFASLPACIAHIRSGRLRALATSTRNRLTAPEELRNVPAVSESVPGYECVAWTALVGPAGLPAEVRNTLATAVQRINEREAVRTRFEQMGNYVDPTMTVERSRAWIKSEGEKFSQVIAAAKISID